MGEVPEITSCSLSELALKLKTVVRDSFSSPVWVRAEISELYENANGNCYLELIEKSGDKIVARQKAVVLSFTYRMLKPYFEENTGIAFSAGISVLVACVYDFHEIYGLSLHIKDVEPSYTVGEAARRKLEILRRLSDEGVADMNRQLLLPLVPNRVAIISSATAAGYGDFVDQLTHNGYQYKFYHRLFPAVMQGNATEESVIAALDTIFAHYDDFDVVVIIRGGGATAELAAFDNYAIALHCAQFPLPIIVGIGHQRDDTVLDAVAYRSVKTPTAAAEFLIDAMRQAEMELDGHIQALAGNVQTIMEEYRQGLRTHAMKLRYAVQTFSHHRRSDLQTIKMELVDAFRKRMFAENRKADAVENRVKMLNPAILLKKGYTLTLKNGRIVTSKTSLSQGDTIETLFSDGSVWSVVDKNKNRR